jgi:thiamine-phosphate pyrophosphorylase
MKPAESRILDANANRAREALRVLEDYARFVLDDGTLSGQLKELRHGLAAALQQLHIDDALLARDTTADVGTAIKTTAEFNRHSLADVVTAAGKRLSEALRVLEEIAKTIDPAPAAAIEQLRYRGYTLEQTLVRIARQTDRFADVQLYVLLTASLCKHSWEHTLECLILGGAQCIQLRENDLPDAEFLRRARFFASKCRAAGVISIINDRTDIAQLAAADGVHLGQTDLPCTEARKLLGHHAIIGVSTENLDQARQAVRDGATYIGVGPMFPTSTKEKPRLAGPAYAAQAFQAVTVPCVAIGGITPHNVDQLIAVGVRTVAVCSAIIGDADPAVRCRDFANKLSASQGVLADQ